MGYWLMKSEPDTYGIADLEKEGVNMWEGCRNYVVRNYFRDAMQVGDLAFFYHSNAKPSGIVGTMQIVSEPYPDPTQFDPKSHYYDPAIPFEDIQKWLRAPESHLRVVRTWRDAASELFEIELAPHPPIAPARNAPPNAGGRP